MLPYERALHLPFMEAWIAMHKMPSFLADELPEIGYVSLYEGNPIAMIFLRRLEACHTAMIDSLITYPDALPALRHEAIDQLVYVLIEKAKELNFKQVIANSVDPNTLTRALRHGFQHLPNTMMAIQLSLEGNAE